MTAKDLEGLFEYGYWANRRLFEVVARLTPEEFTQPVGGSYGSIRDTLVHTLSAEAGWLDRCGGPKRGPKLDPANFPTFDSVAQAWRRVEAEMRDFLANLQDDDLDRRVEYSFPPVTNSGTVGELLHHAANHAVHHRGQVALLLRMLGHVPGDFDILFYYARKPGER